MVDVRMISATHRDLRADIATGRFREDLYYRLDVVALTIPALSQRRENISLLANHFLNLFSTKYDKNINGFSPETMEILVGASWPGNVRQLMNIVEQYVALSTIPLISPVLVREAMHKEEERLISFKDAGRHFERDYLVRVLKIAADNVTQAARLAKRNRTEFYKLLKKISLTLPFSNSYEANS